MSLEQYGVKHNKAYWTFDLKYYGPPNVIDAQWEYSKQALSAIPGAWFENQDEYRFPLAADPKDLTCFSEFGIPSLSSFSLGGVRAPFSPFKWPSLVRPYHSPHRGGHLRSQ